MEILTGLLVLITGVYAFFTYKILKANEAILAEMRNEHEALFKPYISIALAEFPDDPRYYLSIKNIGKTEAKNLKLTLDKDFYKNGKRADGNNIKKLPPFADPIMSFAPGAEIFIYLATHVMFFKEGSREDIIPKTFKIQVQYEFGNKTESQTTTIDLNPFKRTSKKQDPLIKKLKEIKKTLEDLKC